MNKKIDDGAIVDNVKAARTDWKVARPGVDFRVNLDFMNFRLLEGSTFS